MASRWCIKCGFEKLLDGFYFDYEMCKVCVVKDEISRLKHRYRKGKTSKKNYRESFRKKQQRLQQFETEAVDQIIVENDGDKMELASDSEESPFVASTTDSEDIVKPREQITIGESGSDVSTSEEFGLQFKRVIPPEEDHKIESSVLIVISDEDENEEQEILEESDHKVESSVLIVISSDEDSDVNPRPIKEEILDDIFGPVYLRRGDSSLGNQKCSKCPWFHQASKMYFDDQQNGFCEDCAKASGHTIVN